MTLEEHILDQMRRYQSVTLSFAQADMVLGLIARVAGPACRCIDLESAEPTSEPSSQQDQTS